MKNPIKPAPFARFLAEFPKRGNVYLSESVLWYALDMSIHRYLGMSIHERINFKQSYFEY